MNKDVIYIEPEHDITDILANINPCNIKSNSILLPNNRIYTFLSLSSSNILYRINIHKKFANGRNHKKIKFRII